MLNKYVSACYDCINPRLGVTLGGIRNVAANI